ncbi:hypothetical protein RhiirC2_719002 [Rhizophagus irregularis]|uniref:Uncharacterized protein n=1 Tax=Rhizophagus irregularis TaxID=588596 RepID=A0A2N1MG30_9GLOM|nr:hypothetical protein RhiirC2_719002 [Rhizophagus irregularis]
MDFHINYGSNNNKENEEKLTSIVQVVDQNYIPREGYRVLVSIESNLEREWAVSNQRHKITRNINQKIPITLINIPINSTQNESVFEDNLNTFSVGITETIQNIKNGGYRSVKDILIYIVPVLILNGILDVNNPIIHLRISGDGRNVGRKIKHVMITMAILDDEQNINKPDYHYTIVLYLDHWVPDELHIMLRIWDRLWSLVLAELKEYNQFDNICRDEIIQEMNRIGVNFQFWQERGVNTWSHSSLMGQEKSEIYGIDLQFQFEVEDWLELFLTPDRLIPNTTHTEKGLYKLSEITPYIHVLVCHMSEFMEKHKQWGIKAFSCAPVEKKIISRLSVISLVK